MMTTRSFWREVEDEEEEVVGEEEEEEAEDEESSSGGLGMQVVMNQWMRKPVTRKMPRRRGISWVAVDTSLADPRPFHLMDASMAARRMVTTVRSEMASIALRMLPVSR